MQLILQKFCTLQHLAADPLPLVALQNTNYSLLNKSNNATKPDGNIFSAVTSFLIIIYDAQYEAHKKI